MKRNPGSILVLANPSRRHKRKASHKHHAKRRHSKRKSGFLFARRNPIAMIGGMVPTVKTAGIGAIGALANDILSGFYAPKLPAALSGSTAIAGIKVLSALAIGFVANKVKAGSGRALAIGAATCALHDGARALILAKFPSVPMAGYVNGYGEANSGYPGPTQIGDYPTTAQPVNGYVHDVDSGYGDN